AYEMVGSDWSSDVCSSDLAAARADRPVGQRCLHRSRRSPRRLGTCVRGTHEPRGRAPRHDGHEFHEFEGLPDRGHYSTASDLALLTFALIREYPEYYKLYSEREYRYNDITQRN